MPYFVIAATAAIGIYLNISATLRLLRSGPQRYERGQMRAQLALIWILPYAGALLVSYFLNEGNRRHRAPNPVDDTATDFFGSGEASSDSGSLEGAGDHCDAGGADGGSD